MSRVVLVSPYAFSVHGGVQEQVLAMSRELGRRGHEVLVVAPDRHDAAPLDTPASVERFGPLLSLPANGSRAPLTLSPLAARAARKAVEAFQPTIVHFHEPFAPLVGWGLLRSHRAPSVGTFHRSGEGPALSLTRPLLRSLAGSIDVAVAVSDAAATTIMNAAKVHADVLFNGFETERFLATPRVRDDEVLLVTLGRLEERKGTQYAIRAVRAHNARGREPWRLVVIGEGPERPRLEALAAGDDMITFVGSVDDETKRRWLRRAHALVAPALRGESFGLVLLEAMASETLVVASDITGYREASGAHAVLFTPGETSSLEEALTRALASETPEWIAGARRHAENWSMRSLVDAYETRYAEAGEVFRARQ